MFIVLKLKKQNFTKTIDIKGYQLMAVPFAPTSQEEEVVSGESQEVTRGSFDGAEFTMT